MSDRVIILGLPGSGTSTVAEVYHRKGYSDCPPTFTRGGRPSNPRESLAGRAVNRIVLGAPEIWPTWRWHHDYRPRNPYNDPELHALARWFVETADAQYDRWFFKNPEPLLCWHTVWKRYDWTEIVGVYRHPEEATKCLHSEESMEGRQSVWNAYSRLIAQVCTRFVRFPDDLPGLAEEFGVDDPIVPGKQKVHRNGNPAEIAWCGKWWKELEARRG